MSNPSQQDAALARPPPVPLAARTPSANPNRTVTGLRNRPIGSTPIPPTLQAKMAAVGTLSHLPLSCPHLLSPYGILPSVSLCLSSSFFTGPSPHPSSPVVPQAAPCPSMQPPPPSRTRPSVTGRCLHLLMSPSVPHPPQPAAPALLHSAESLVAAWASPFRSSAAWTWDSTTPAWAAVVRIRIKTSNPPEGSLQAHSPPRSPTSER